VVIHYLFLPIQVTRVTLVIFSRVHRIPEYTRGSHKFAGHCNDTSRQCAWSITVHVLAEYDYFDLTAVATTATAEGIRIDKQQASSDICFAVMFH